MSYAPALNAFFNATYGLRGTWRFAPTGKPFTLRRACRGPRLQLPRQRGVRLDSCSKMLGRVSFQVVEYDRPMEKGQYDRLLALRAKFKVGRAATGVARARGHRRAACLACRRGAQSSGV